MTADPVAIGEVGRGILDEVKQNGFTVEPVYTGQRGGVELLFEILMLLKQRRRWFGTDIYAQRDAIGVVNNLFGILGDVSSVVMLVFYADEKHEAKHAVVAQEQASRQD